MMFGSSDYMNIHDSAGDTPTEAGTIAVKFCSAGFVVSQTWTSAFIVVQDGNVRVYDSQDTFRGSPFSYVLEIHLSKHHTVSKIKPKTYVQNGGVPIDFYCFYVELDNGMFGPTKLLKVGCSSMKLAQKLCDCIRSVTSM